MTELELQGEYGGDEINTPEGRKYLLRPGGMKRGRIVNARITKIFSNFAESNRL